MIESPSNRSMSNTRCLKPGVILKERYKIVDSESHTVHGIRSYSRMLQSRSIIRPGLRRGAQIRRRSVCRLDRSSGNTIGEEFAF